MSSLNSKAALSVGGLFKHIVLILGVLVSIFPFIWMAITAFKPEPETLLWPPRLLPMEPTWQNFINIFTRWPFHRFFLNSFIFAGVSTITILLTSSAAGYAFAKIKFRGRDLLFFIFLATMILPFETYMIPVYLFVNKLGWLNTYQGLILPFVIMSFGLFLMRQTIQSIPDELIDAARVDGCSEFRIYGSLILPLSKGSLSALAIYAFISVYGFFTWPLVVTTTQNMYTTELGLAMFQKAFFTEYALSMAGATVTSLPLILLFLFFQRNIITGITLTGLKG